jgi:hypothetical protein
VVAGEGDDKDPRQLVADQQLEPIRGRKAIAVDR